MNRTTSGFGRFLILGSATLLTLTACSSDGTTNTATTTTTVASPTATASSSAPDAAPSPTLADSSPTASPAPSTGTPDTSGQAIPADTFLVADSIYTVALDQGRGCNFQADNTFSCGVVANTNNGVPSTGGMLGVEDRGAGFITWEAGGQPYLGDVTLAPGQHTTIRGVTVTHHADGTMETTHGGSWFKVTASGDYTSNLNTPAARGETVNAGQSCGTFFYDIGGAEQAELIAGADNVNCVVAMERIVSYYAPQLNDSPYPPGEGTITLRGGSKCTDTHQVDGTTTQACTAADGSQLAYLKH